MLESVRIKTGAAVFGLNFKKIIDPVQVDNDLHISYKNVLFENLYVINKVWLKHMERKMLLGNGSLMWGQSCLDFKAQIKETLLSFGVLD